MIDYSTMEAELYQLLDILEAKNVHTFSLLLIDKDEFLTEGNFLHHYTPLSIVEPYSVELLEESLLISKPLLRTSMVMHSIHNPYIYGEVEVVSYFLMGMSIIDSKRFLPDKQRCHPFIRNELWRERTLDVEWLYRLI